MTARRLRILLALFCLVPGFMALSGCPGATRTGNSVDVPLAEGPVGAGGGTIEVTDAGSPYFGAAVIIPPGTVAEEVQVQLFASEEPIGPLHGGNLTISPSLDVEPADFPLSAPVTVRLPVEAPLLAPGLSLVSYMAQQNDPDPPVSVPFLDDDYSDGLASALTFELGTFQVLGTAVSPTASSVAIVQPPSVSNQHAVTVGSPDPILVEIRVVGDGALDLDAIINNFPALYRVTARFVNTNNPGTAVFPVTGTPGPQNLSYVGGGDDHFALSTTADLFPPSSEEGTITVETRVHGTSYAPAYGNPRPCLSADPSAVQCTPVDNLPADPFVAVP
ncbi:MAG: hypothetical protein AB1405_00520 [Bdellovibrionota bacterium]